MSLRSFPLFVCRYAMGVCGVILVLLLAPFSKRHRNILHDILFALHWRKRPLPVPAAPPLEIATVPCGSFFGYEMQVCVLHPDAVSGNVSGYELVVIDALAGIFGKSSCFEIGTFDGRTTLNLAANTPDCCRIFTLDLPTSRLGNTAFATAPGDERFIDKPASGSVFQGTRYAPRITQLVGDSARFDFSPYEGKIDLVFVDGSHSAEYVRNDTEVALRLLKPEAGVIVWHDYASPYWKDLTRTLNDLNAEPPFGGRMRHFQGTTLVVWERGREGMRAEAET